MQATDFTRDDCKLGRRRISYSKLEREYRCADCGGRLGMKWSEAEDYPENWHVECLACGSLNFIHKCQRRRQQTEAVEVLDGLPSELAAAMGYERKEATDKPVIFSLAAAELVEL